MDLASNLEQGRAAFNGGQYFEAHELWEEAWHQLAGAERIFVQGLIQIAAGLHHLEQRRPGPAAGLLGKGLEKISRGVPAPFAHLQVEALARDVERLLAELAAAGATVPDPRALRL
jgi:predicted metal-dependent hydrolase